MKKISKENFSSYHRNGIVQTRDGGMICLTDEIKNKIWEILEPILNNPKNRRKRK